MFPRRSHRSTDPDALSRRADDHVILDVREADEWQAGHVAGAVHIPMGELGGRLDELPTDAPIITVCRSGRRSGQVAKALAKQGFDATNLDGGLQAWHDRGLPLTADDGTTGRVA
jgi:rhodanese-related sulfurtransferase